MQYRLPTIALAFLLASAGSAWADPIIYTEVLTGSGTLGTTSFSNAQVTLSGTGDTSQIMGSANSPDLILNSATVDVAGIGLATFNDTVIIFATSNDGFIQFEDQDTEKYLGEFMSSALDGYDLATAIGPVTGTLSSSDYGPGATTLGTFTLSSFNTNQTGDNFQAILPSAVPEPSSLVLMGIGGIAGLVYVRARRRRVA